MPLDTGGVRSVHCGGHRLQTGWMTRDLKPDAVLAGTGIALGFRCLDFQVQPV
jgi:hypothetical protein